MHQTIPVLSVVLAFCVGAPRVFCQGTEAPPRGLRDLNTSYFPFTPVKSKEEWAVRREDVKRRVLMACNLWPLPDQTPLNAVVHGRVERDDYTIDRVFFESVPGHFVTGSLYLPKKRGASMPGVLCPHGHWPNGRFMEAGAAEVKKQFDMKAEELECAARSPLQARCVQLARMGCVVFHYDMLGYADSVQLFADDNGKVQHRHGFNSANAVNEQGKWTFLTPQADLRLQTNFGLQTWNSYRALDFLLTVDGVDPRRIGITGASGGGTQSMISAGIDDRIAAVHPCVMVSTAMQGGCTCENSHLLRINQGNIDIAALTAPRPLGMTAADDWTKELETKGLPDLKRLYAMLGAPDKVTAHIATQFPHNYNLPSRIAMYHFFNKHFHLGLSEPVKEREFVFSTKNDLTVWTKDHPAPTGDQVGDPHERAVCKWMTGQDEKHIHSILLSRDPATHQRMNEIVGGAWKTLIGRDLPAAGDVTFAPGKKEDRGFGIVVEGVTHLASAKEEVPCAFVYPQNWNGTCVLWLSLKKGDLFIKGAPSPAVVALLDAGIAVARPELYLPDATENPKAGENTKCKPGTFQEFCGYTYGYNPTLLARRVHDAMTTLVMMKTHPRNPAGKVIIVGVNGAAPVAAAACAMGKSSVDGLAIAPGGFTFAKITSFWDVNFMPGVVKYGDMNGLLSICAPVRVAHIGGDSPDSGRSVAVAVVSILNPENRAR